jgi:hypothetical protein
MIGRVADARKNEASCRGLDLAGLEPRARGSEAVQAFSVFLDTIRRPPVIVTVRSAHRDGALGARRPTMARRLSGDDFKACPCPSDDGGAGGTGDSRRPTFVGTRTRINAGRASPIVIALVLASALLGFAPAARAQTPPAHMNTIIGKATTTKAQLAEENMLALNVAMFGYYDRALRLYQQRLLAQHPVILALFSGAGGEFTLYRPGMTPLRAPSVPTVYQVLKSVGHSSMALFQIAGPHLDNPADQSWRALMEVDRIQHKVALDTLADVAMEPSWRDNVRVILENNIALIDSALAKGVITYADLSAFAKKQAPYLAKNVAWGAEVQVAHWMGVVEGWKRMLGKDWDTTYAVSNSIYVARQNNVLFSVLAQYFGPDAINSRLMLFETIDFTTSADDMLTGLTRVVADRSVGAEFFGNYYLMDYELMGGHARDAIVSETQKRGMAPFLPPLAPFGSHEWPWKITPGPGPGTLRQLLSP